MLELKIKLIKIKLFRMVYTSSYFINEQIEVLRRQDLKDVESREKDRKVAIQVEKNNIEQGERIKREISIEDRKEPCVVLADSDRCCVDWVALLHSHADVLVKASFSCPFLGAKRSEKITKDIKIYYYPTAAPLEIDDNKEERSMPVNTLKSIEKHALFLAVDSFYLTERENIRKHLSNILKREISFWEPSKKLPQDSLVFVLSENQGFLEYFRENHFSIDLSIDSLKEAKKLIAEISESVESIEQKRMRLIISKVSLAERIKEAETFGVVFTSSDHMDTVNILSKYLDQHRKKFYHFYINGLKPQKLGNYIGIDVFIMVQCPFSSFRFEENIVIARPYDLILAFRPQWQGEYLTDLQESARQIEKEIQLIEAETSNSSDSKTESLVIKSQCNLLKLQPGEICTKEHAIQYFRTGEFLKAVEGITIQKSIPQENYSDSLEEGYSGIPMSYKKHNI
ncbi:diphthamide biosynthesis protein 2 [Nematocida sp. LUAm3]|nr:diphthamide biosynthesis protein 2 [Nematocida sp. LUAm3]KAI5174758.1 diphthamide biosynthesis protein 2 [Nematocida sp. LUAm2]KAI5177831.1 diphthamide biosynthesis protein 2 [Nematocida sp. LUAm1]